MKRFYERVLPSRGLYCVATIDPNGAITHYFHETLPDLFYRIMELKQFKTNIYVTPGTFNAERRKTENSECVKSFFIDLDVGKKKSYHTKDEALKDLDRFVKDTELPPPVRLDSGNGIHAYWIFDCAIPYDEWKPYAEKFKALCKEYNLSIDPAVTADAARLMRCPGTINQRGNKPTSIIDKEIHEYSFSAFKDFLGETDADIKKILETAPHGLDEDSRKMLGYDNFETMFRLIAQKSVDDEGGCNQIKYILENVKTLSEPMWYAGLSIARHCADWEECIYEMSVGYPTYTPEKTLKKANQSIGMPQGCGVFEEHNPGGCNDCPHRGKISNPLPLGRRLKTEATPLPAGTKPSEDQPMAPVFPKFLKPFARGVNGGIYYIPPAAVDKDGKKHEKEPILMSQHDLFPIKRMYSHTDGECLLMRLVLPNDPPREFLLPLKIVSSESELKKLLAAQMGGVEPPLIMKWITYFNKWTQYLINMEAAEQMRMQMGWTEDRDAFVIGSTEVLKNGKERKAAASPWVNSVAKLLVRHGDYEKWQKAVNKLAMPGLELYAFTMFCGFGSPLMTFTSVNGVTICLTGGSGNGKTGAMYCGASIWGEPHELCMGGMKTSATENGAIGWYLGLKNIMFGMDEASNKGGEELSNLVHRISQGKSKIRMRSDVNAVRELEQSASLISVWTSNQSIYSKLHGYKNSPDGELARLIELDAQRATILQERPELGRAIYQTVRENYGYAGPEYVKYLFKVGDHYIREKMDKWFKRFISDFGHNVTYRFYEGLVMAAFGGAELAAEAGIIQMDNATLNRIYEVVLHDMMSSRESGARINDTDYEEILGRFLNEHHTGLLILNEDRVVSEPRAPLIGRIEVHNQKQYIAKSEVRKYLTGLQVSTRDFEQELKKSGVLADSTRKQRLSTGWKAGMNYPAVAVYTFKSELPEELTHGRDNPAAG